MIYDMTSRHFLYGITRCYLSPDTSECTSLNPSHTGQYSNDSHGRIARWL